MNTERSKSLDGIRGVAILAVMANHTRLPLAKGGYLGVDVFFVLSGYLITTILLREHERNARISPRRFYSRRGLRLYPALIVTCAIAIAVPTLVDFTNRPQALRGAGVAAAYLQDVAINLGWRTGTGLSHTWTLAIEEQFYVLWPPLLIVLLRSRRRRERLIAGLLCAGIAYSLIVLVTAFHPSSSPTSGVYYRPDARAGALLLGCLVAVLLQREVRRLPRCAGWISFVVLLAVLLAAPEANTAVAFFVAMPLVWVASALVTTELATNSTGALARLVGRRPLAATGLISYGLYLLHPLVYAVIAHHTSLPRREGAPLAIALSFVAAIVSYKVVEAPFLRLKDRLASGGSIAGDIASSRRNSSVS